jgi:hypothetical protein
MLDAAQGSSILSALVGGPSGTLQFGNLLDAQTITATAATPSGNWLDTAQYEGYLLFLVALGVLTGSATVQVQLQSSAAKTGASPVSGGASAQFPQVSFGNTAGPQALLLPTTFFANRYVGASAVVSGTGNVPIAIYALGGLRSP